MTRLSRLDDVHSYRAAAAVIADNDDCGLNEFNSTAHARALIIGFDLVGRANVPKQNRYSHFCARSVFDEK